MLVSTLFKSSVYPFNRYLVNHLGQRLFCSGYSTIQTHTHNPKLVFKKLLWTMPCYSVLRRNELSNCKKIWRNLNCIWLSDRSQSEKATDCRIPTLWHLEKAQLWGQWQISGCQGLERRLLGQWYSNHGWFYVTFVQIYRRHPTVRDL